MDKKQILRTILDNTDGDKDMIRQIRDECNEALQNSLGKTGHGVDLLRDSLRKTIDVCDSLL